MSETPGVNVRAFAHRAAFLIELIVDLGHHALGSVVPNALSLVLEHEVAESHPGSRCFVSRAALSLLVIILV